MESKGYIYILTNPAFPQYVKIGYADDVGKRLQQLNRNEGLPFAFRCYATYEVNTRLTDMKIHSVIDRLNPELRTIDNINGKKRVREFYAMSPEDAYGVLEAIAEINGLEKNLRKWEKTKEESEAESLSESIAEEHMERKSPFQFSMCGIEVGEEIASLEKPEIKCTVYDDRHVFYQDEIWSLSALAKKLTGWKRLPQGPAHFTYKGQTLSDLRSKCGK